MNIKQVEEITGISKQNIRYYEKEGLISPKRNLLNAYREYGEEEIRRMKVIRILRMLDMPISQIRYVLDKKLDLTASLEQQQKFLEERMDNLRSAIEFCDTLQRENLTIDTINPDDCLKKMEEKKSGFFEDWIMDYRLIAKEEHERRFSFVPDDAVTTPAEFTNVLLDFARKHNRDITITKEGMYPEFRLDGKPYSAQRIYTSASRCPLAVVVCERADMPKQELTGRKKWLRRLHASWPVLAGVVLDAFILIRMGNAAFTPEGLIIPIAILGMSIGGTMYTYHTLWNIQD